LPAERVPAANVTTPLSALPDDGEVIQILGLAAEDENGNASALSTTSAISARR
jgi:hypothetical protein